MTNRVCQPSHRGSLLWDLIGHEEEYHTSTKSDAPSSGTRPTSIFHKASPRDDTLGTATHHRPSASYITFRHPYSHCRSFARIACSLLFHEIISRLSVFDTRGPYAAPRDVAIRRDLFDWIVPFYPRPWDRIFCSTDRRIRDDFFSIPAALPPLFIPHIRNQPWKDPPPHIPRCYAFCLYRRWKKRGDKPFLAHAERAKNTEGCCG